VTPQNYFLISGARSAKNKILLFYCIIMKILAIETSCDETAVALVEASGELINPSFKIIKSEVASQIKLHAKYGGVVPNLAKREHIKNLPILLEKISRDYKSKTLNPKSKNPKLITNYSPLITDIDAIAVTVGPGLEPALWVGVEFARQLSKEWKKPLIGVNHMEGHLYSFLLKQKTVSTKLKTLNSKKISNIKNKSLDIRDWDLRFPMIALVVSGGHTILVLLKSLKEYKKLGETLDDAVGESFDKVARLLDLPYPGGPELEKIAKKGDPKSVPFPSPMINQKNYNFSYSGLKTSVLYYMRNKSSQMLTNDANNVNKKMWKSGQFDFSEKEKANSAASFQFAAFNPLVKKAIRAAQEFGAKTIVIGGGVAANKNLAKLLKLEIKNSKLKINLIVPPIKYCMDNAVMIAVATYINKFRNKKYPIKADGNLNL